MKQFVLIFKSKSNDHENKNEVHASEWIQTHCGYGALELFSSSCRIIMKRYSKKNREAIRGLQLSSFSPRKRKSWPGALASNRAQNPCS